MRTVADAMTAAVNVPAAMTIQEASTAMLDAGVQAAVVTERGRVSGLLTADGVSRALASGRDAGGTPVRDAADPDPLVVAPDEPLAEAHLRMRTQGRALAPVVGPDGEPLGLLTDSDPP